MSTDVDDVAIIIPMYNARDTIGAQLESLASGSACPHEVILVDNNSRDDSVAVAESYRDRFPELSVLHCAQQGANAARNMGVEACTRAFVLFLDADDRVEKDWFEKVTARLPWDALAGGLRECRVEGDQWTAFGPDRSAVYDHDFLPDVSTASAGVRRAVWQEIGGFNESYTLGGDDTEFFWRVMFAGYEVESVPDALVWYRARPGWRAAWRQRWRHGLADARLHQEFRHRGWEGHYRSKHLWNLGAGTKSMLLGRISPWEWFTRLAVATGAVYAATFRRYDNRPASSLVSGVDG